MIWSAWFLHSLRVAGMSIHCPHRPPAVPAPQLDCGRGGGGAATPPRGRTPATPCCDTAAGAWHSGPPPPRPDRTPGRHGSWWPAAADGVGLAARGQEPRPREWRMWKPPGVRHLNHATNIFNTVDRGHTVHYTFIPCFGWLYYGYSKAFSVPPCPLPFLCCLLPTTKRPLAADQRSRALCFGSTRLQRGVG